eukprot:m.86339 g.86339  ORF g.86339 m.86339 type:complete len:579 (+) comp14872_c0_seq1:255-1991(+)
MMRERLFVTASVSSAAAAAMPCPSAAAGSNACSSTVQLVPLALQPPAGSPLAAGPSYPACVSSPTNHVRSASGATATPMIVTSSPNAMVALNDAPRPPHTAMTTTATATTATATATTAQPALTQNTGPVRHRTGTGAKASPPCSLNSSLSSLSWLLTLRCDSGLTPGLLSPREESSRHNHNHNLNTNQHQQQQHSHQQNYHQHQHQQQQQQQRQQQQSLGAQRRGAAGHGSKARRNGASGGVDLFPDWKHNVSAEPPFSMAALAYIALASGKKPKRLSLVEIYKFVNKEFAYYRSNSDFEWKTAIKTELGRHAAFSTVKNEQETASPDRGHTVWTVDTGKAAELRQALSQYKAAKRLRKKAAKAAAAAVAAHAPSLLGNTNGNDPQTIRLLESHTEEEMMRHLQPNAWLSRSVNECIVPELDDVPRPLLTMQPDDEVMSVSSASTDDVASLFDDADLEDVEVAEFERFDSGLAARLTDRNLSPGSSFTSLAITGGLATGVPQAPLLASFHNSNRLLGATPFWTAGQTNSNGLGHSNAFAPNLFACASEFAEGNLPMCTNDVEDEIDDNDFGPIPTDWN